MDKILVVVPTFNEVQSLPLLLEKIFSLPFPVSVLVVDDHSPDGTSQKVKALQEIYERLFLMTRPRKMGIGSAYREGFAFARENNFDPVVQMDGDLTHDPGLIARLRDVLRDQDMVIASRYVKGARVVACPWGRRYLSRIGNVLAAMLLRLPVVDATSGFRIFKREALERIAVSTTTSEGFVFQIETVWRARAAGLRMAEVPFCFVNRRFQRSKFSFKICAEALGRMMLWAVVRRPRFARHEAGQEPPGRRRFREEKGDIDQVMNKKDQAPEKNQGQV
jgi:dolichol-phosphate mannosyltransferase